MPALENPRHEAFARAVVKGMSGRDAYGVAGYKAKPRAADASASRLLAGANVAARVAELKNEVAERVVSAKVMSLTEVLEEFSKLGRANMQNYVAAGGSYTDDVIEALQNLKPEHAAAIQELTVETYQEGGGDDAREVKRVKLKLHDKRGPLSELRRHFEPDKHELTGKDGKPIETKDVSEPLSELELARRLAFVLELGARKAKATGAKAPPAKRARKKRARGEADGGLDKGRDQASGRAQAQS